VLEEEKEEYRFDVDSSEDSVQLLEQEINSWRQDEESILAPILLK